jgi:ABC-type phosphate transport system permease subunit
MARGAGEVAPLMLVGAVNLAPGLAGRAASFPYRPRQTAAFMHLGFHIYDLGFQSPDSEAARPHGVDHHAAAHRPSWLLLNLAAIAAPRRAPPQARRRTLRGHDHRKTEQDHA